jgi:small GTP-binding protein
MNDEKEDKKNKNKYIYKILPEDFGNKPHLNFKVILLGDSGVGKTCLSNRAINNNFSKNYFATIGFEFSSFNIKINDTIIKLQIWDTCGQELYRSLVSSFYRNTSLGIIVYSIISKESFENIEQWLKDLKTYSNPDIKLFLIGNKLDLENERVISKKEGETLANNYKFNLFMEASAKTGINAQNIFIEASKILYEDYLKYKDLDLNGDINNSKETSKSLNKKGEKDEKGGCC